MHSNNIGKKIKKLNFSKNKITLILSDNKKIVTSFGCVKTLKLKEGEILPNKKLKEIENYNLTEKCRGYLTKIIAKHEYSEKEIRQKLQSKRLNTIKIDELIKEFKSNGLINDNNFLSDYVRVYSKKNYSINRIKSDLLSKGISLNEVSKIKSSFKQEYLKAEVMLSKRLKTYEKNSFLVQKRKSYNYLKSLQFETDVINDVVNNYVIYSCERELKNLRREYSIAFSKYRYKYLGDLLTDKVIEYLLRRGFSLTDIKLIEREY